MVRFVNRTRVGGVRFGRVGLGVTSDSLEDQEVYPGATPALPQGSIRGNERQSTSMPEYRRFWLINQRKSLSNAPPSIIIKHPLKLVWDQEVEGSNPFAPIRFDS
jgi:hypothetical protein